MLMSSSLVNCSGFTPSSSTSQYGGSTGSGMMPGGSRAKRILTITDPSTGEVVMGPGDASSTVSSVSPVSCTGGYSENVEEATPTEIQGQQLPMVLVPVKGELDKVDNPLYPLQANLGRQRSLQGHPSIRAEDAENLTSGAALTLIPMLTPEVSARPRMVNEANEKKLEGLITRGTMKSKVDASDQQVSLAHSSYYRNLPPRLQESKHQAMGDGDDRSNITSVAQLPFATGFFNDKSACQAILPANLSLASAFQSQIASEEEASTCVRVGFPHVENGQQYAASETSLGDDEVFSFEKEWYAYWFFLGIFRQCEPGTMIPLPDLVNSIDQHGDEIIQSYVKERFFTERSHLFRMDSVGYRVGLQPANLRDTIEDLADLIRCLAAQHGLCMVENAYQFWQQHPNSNEIAQTLSDFTLLLKLHPFIFSLGFNDLLVSVIGPLPKVRNIPMENIPKIPLASQVKPKKKMSSGSFHSGDPGEFPSPPEQITTPPSGYPIPNGSIVDSVLRHQSQLIPWSANSISSSSPEPEPGGHIVDLQGNLIGNAMGEMILVDDLDSSSSDKGDSDSLRRPLPPVSHCLKMVSSAQAGFDKEQLMPEWRRSMNGFTNGNSTNNQDTFQKQTVTTNDCAPPPGFAVSMFKDTKPRHAQLIARNPGTLLETACQSMPGHCRNKNGGNFCQTYSGHRQGHSEAPVSTSQFETFIMCPRCDCHIALRTVNNSNNHLNKKLATSSVETTDTGVQTVKLAVDLVKEAKRRLGYAEFTQ